MHKLLIAVVWNRELLKTAQILYTEDWLHKIMVHPRNRVNINHLK